MKPLALAAVLMTAMPVPAAAHCYSVWKYPWRQRCGVIAVASRLATVRSRLPTVPEIALPSLTKADLVGGEADEAAKGRLLLRGALEGR